MRKFLLLCISILCLTSITTIAQSSSDSILASVDGVPISLGDILPATLSIEKTLYASRSGDDLAKAIRDLRLKALNELIDQKLIIADYLANKPFDVPQQMIERYLDDMAENLGIRSRSEFISRVRSAEMTIDEVRVKALEQIVVRGMRSRHSFVHVNITPKDIYDYFQAHKTEFSTPEKWGLSMILISSKRENREELTKEVKAKLATGNLQDFAKLATLYSAGPNGNLGGSIGKINRENLRPEFAKEISTPEKGKFYGPISTTEGDYFLAITSIDEAVEPSLKSVEAEIKERLSQELRTKALEKYIDSLRSKAIIQLFL